MSELDRTFLATASPHKDGWEKYSSNYGSASRWLTHKLRIDSVETQAIVRRETKSIRDVIAFPKTHRGQDLMVDAPMPLTEKQLRELDVKLRNVQR